MFNLNKKLVYSFLVAVILVPFLAKAEDRAPAYLQFLPSQFSGNKIVIEVWNSPNGLKMLADSQYKNDFYQLAGFFQPQINPVFCGVASSVMVLNALREPKDQAPNQESLQVVRPEVVGGNIARFHAYSQLTFLNEQTDKIKDRSVIELKNVNDPKEKIDAGLQLAELSDILHKVYQLKVKINYVNKVNKSKIADFRALLKKVLVDQDHFIIVELDGKVVGAKTGGHYSPLVAYNQNSDMVLVMDVAGHKEPWYWVKIEDLYRAMNTLDGKKYRGYLVVEDQN